MSRKREREKYEFKSQSYFRLLRYATPYKFKLIVGILAGFVVAGSLFSGLMLVPQILKGVVPEAEKSSETLAKAESVVTVLDKNAAADHSEKVDAVEKVIAPKKMKNISSMVEQWKEKASSWGFHLPVRYADGALRFSWPGDFR